MKKIDASPWNYTLYENEEGKLILSVLCGTSAMYDTVIKLDNDEIELYSSGQILEVAKKIRDNPKAYSARKITGFIHPKIDK